MRRNIRLIAGFGVLMVILMIASLNVLAQEGDTVITADDVNRIASKLFCPVCENIPLDTCGTAACEDWRNEIRIYLAAGMNEEEIISDFVFRFGDRVVGTPQDPILRAMSLVTPWVLIGLAFAVTAHTFIRWRANHSAPIPTAVAAAVSTGKIADDDYRNRLERDVQEV